MKRALFLMTLLCLAVPTATGQEPAKVAPKHYKVGAVTSDYLGSISPDGRFLSFMDARGAYDEVFILDLKTGERRRLTNAGSDGEAGDSIISRDGRRVAYSWVNSKDGFRELHTIGLDGTGDRIFYRSKNMELLIPKDWSTDGKYILAAFQTKEATTQIVVVSVADGSLRVLKTVDRILVGGGGNIQFSPDGRYIAYNLLSRQNPPDWDIFVLPFDARREILLVAHPGIDRLLGWTLDGKRVLFTSDRSGTVDAWVIEVADGKPRGTPTLVKADLGPVSGLGFTRNGSYYYGTKVWVNDVYLTILDPATGILQPAQKLVGHVGFNMSVDWSPDGRYLAYTRGRGLPEEDPLVLGIHSVETGTERRLPLKMTTRAHAFQPEWSSDGRSLLVQARLNFRQGLYRIDAQTGEVTPVVQAEPGCALCMEWPVWPADKKVIFWRRNTRPRSIVLRDIETGLEKELYPSPTMRSSHLALSPDGRRLAFFSSNPSTGETALKVMPAAGGEARELLKLPAPEVRFGHAIFALAWMPDSRHIIYAPSTAGQRKFELWQISAEGGEPQNLGLAMEGLLPYGLSVHPDGKRIALTAGTVPHFEVWVLKDFLPAVRGRAK